MKSDKEFSAEWLRTISLGFLLAAFFGEAPPALRFVFLFAGIAVFAVALYVFSRGTKGHDTWD